MDCNDLNDLKWFYLTFFYYLYTFFGRNKIIVDKNENFRHEKFTMLIARNLINFVLANNLWVKKNYLYLNDAARARAFPDFQISYSDPRSPTSRRAVKSY